MMLNVSLKVFEMDEVMKDAAFVQRLRQLSLGGYSGMNCALNAFEIESRNRSINAKAIMAYVDEASVGWALFSRDPSADRSYFKENSICFQVYVQHEYRHRGIASRLLKRADEISNSDLIRVYWNDAPDFFAQHLKGGMRLENIRPY